jgi:uncharacterized protein (TIGR02246 family)
MNKRLAAAAAIFALSHSPAASAAASSDEKHLRAMVPEMERAWARRDAKAYASQFADDADHINAHGMFWRGQQEIERGIGTALTRVYPNNPIRASDVEVQFLRPDVAVVRYRWRLDSYSTPAGRIYKDPTGRITEVVERTSTGWKIRHFQSTIVDPDVYHER